MKSKTISYISILAEHDSVCRGYYAGLKNGSGVNVEFENTEYQSEKKTLLSRRRNFLYDFSKDCFSGTSNRLQNKSTVRSNSR